MRCEFRAEEAIRFPSLLSANVFRGAAGYLSARTAGFSDLATPIATRPSGFAEPPRPFVFRTRHLDGRLVAPGECFHVDLHLFTGRPELAQSFVEAFSRFETVGLGAERRRVSLESVVGPSLLLVPLRPPDSKVTELRVDFLAPTELKQQGTVAERPEFGLLFDRVCGRIAALSAFYGEQELQMDVAALRGEAGRVVLVNSELRYLDKERRSSRTGQVHSLGGYVGFAEYVGRLERLLPYLAVACWTGVGRHTAWGKGELAVTVSK